MTQGYPFFPLDYNQYNDWVYVILFTLFQLRPLAALSGGRHASVLSSLLERPYFLALQGVLCSSFICLPQPWNQSFFQELWFILLEN